MKKKDTVVTAPVHTNCNNAFDIMRRARVKKLPIIEEDGTLYGMYVWDDVMGIKKKREMFSLDQEGHFLVGAAIGVGEKEMERVDMLYRVLFFSFFLF